jgi:hypothetical protein
MIPERGLESSPFGIRESDLGAPDDERRAVPEGRMVTTFTRW